MEITNKQAITITSEGIAPAKVSVVAANENKSTINNIDNTATVQNNAKDEPKQAEKLQVAVSQINDHMQNLQRNLTFSVDEVTGKDVVIITDSESKEVIRQLPSEEALELARRLVENRGENLQLVNERV